MKLGEFDLDGRASTCKGNKSTFLHLAIDLSYQGSSERPERLLANVNLTEGQYEAIRRGVEEACVRAPPSDGRSPLKLRGTLEIYTD